MEILAEGFVRGQQETAPLNRKDDIPQPMSRAKEILSHPLTTSTSAKVAGAVLMYLIFQIKAAILSPIHNVSASEADTNMNMIWTLLLGFGIGSLFFASLTGHLFNRYEFSLLKSMGMVLLPNEQSEETPYSSRIDVLIHPSSSPQASPYVGAKKQARFEVGTKDQ